MVIALLSENDRKEQLSQAYVAAISARCGFTISIPSLDRDSIDLQVSSGTSRRASVQFQLKATSSPTWDDNELKFQLIAKNYNDLVARRQVPLLLAVMVLPDDPTDWLLIEPDHLILKRSVWWHSLIGLPAIEQGSKQVRIPRANLLTTETLTDLISKSEENLL